MNKQLILTIISAKELPRTSLLVDDRHKYLSVFTAISAKFPDYPGDLIDKAGCERHAWEYLVFKNEAEAAAAGTKFGQLCYKHKIKVFWANAEAGVAGTTPYAPVQNPYRNLEKFVAAFRLAAPTYTKLGYNGFSWQRTSDGRLLHDTAMLKRFDFWSPMNYGTDRPSIEHHWKNKCFKYPEATVIPMIGVGRVDKSGNTWGFWDLHKRLLLARPEVHGVNWFFGNGAKSQMLEGNPHHAPLVTCAKELRQAWDA